MCACISISASPHASSTSTTGSEMADSIPPQTGAATTPNWADDIVALGWGCICWGNCCCGGGHICWPWAPTSGSHAPCPIPNGGSTGGFGWWGTEPRCRCTSRTSEASASGRSPLVRLRASTTIGLEHMHASATICSGEVPPPPSWPGSTG